MILGFKTEGLCYSLANGESRRTLGQGRSSRAQTRSLRTAS